MVFLVREDGTEENITKCLPIQSLTWRVDGRSTVAVLEIRDVEIEAEADVVTHDGGTMSVGEFAKNVLAVEVPPASTRPEGIDAEKRKMLRDDLNRSMLKHVAEKRYSPAAPTLVCLRCGDPAPCVSCLRDVLKP